MVVFIVRKGNPKNIHTWADLTKPGVTVLTPNPITSGGARWNILAAYGAQLVQGKTPAEAQAYLKTLFQHVTAQDKSARQALTSFQNGQADVLLDYESEAVFAQQHGVPISYVIPPQTILIQTPAAVTADSHDPSAASSFLNYLWTPQAQTVFAQHGFRPVVPSVATGLRVVVSAAPAAVYHPALRGVERGQHDVLRPDQGHRHQGPAVAPLPAAAPIGGRPPATPRRRSAPRPAGRPSRVPCTWIAGPCAA